jgi:hypothetical protein
MIRHGERLTVLATSQQQQASEPGEWRVGETIWSEHA